MSKKVIKVDCLDRNSIKAGIKELKAYKKWVLEKEKELRLKLAQRGAEVASISFANAVYDGVNDVTVRVDNTGSIAVIYAEGKVVAFIEFGSGERYGYGHPQAAEFGVGPGTYSEGENGKGHWNDPNGWYYAHGQRSYGNPPSMSMYRAVEVMTEELTTIAREVFGND